MIFGLLLTLFILFVLPLIFQNMNVPGSDYFVAANIFDRMREVLSYVLEIGGLFQGEITSDGTYYN